MFDVGFWELVLLGVIALIVLGPERLPQVARTAGRWVGRARSYANTFTSELDKQTGDLKEQTGISGIRDEFDRAKEEFSRASDEITNAGQELKADTDEAFADIETQVNATMSGSETDAADTNPETTVDEEDATAVEGFGDVDGYVDQYMQGVERDADNQPTDGEAESATAVDNLRDNASEAQGKSS